MGFVSAIIGIMIGFRLVMAFDRYAKTDNTDYSKIESKETWTLSFTRFLQTLL